MNRFIVNWCLAFFATLMVDALVGGTLGLSNFIAATLIAGFISTLMPELGKP